MMHQLKQGHLEMWLCSTSDQRYTDRGDKLRRRGEVLGRISTDIDSVCPLQTFANKHPQRSTSSSLEE